MWFTCLSKTPRQPGVLLVRRSRPAVRPLHGFRLKGAPPVTGFAKPPSDFGPLQSVTRGTRTLIGARSHEVFCPFNATQPIRATAPGLSMPGSCCILLLTMQFDALLPNRSPRCLSTGRVHGVQCPSELDLTEIIPTSRSEYPLLRLANRSCACPIDRSQQATCLAGRQLIRTTFVVGLSRYARIN